MEYINGVLTITHTCGHKQELRELQRLAKSPILQKAGRTEEEYIQDSTEWLMRYPCPDCYKKD